jgi:RluA family pseudouridine synthase
METETIMMRLGRMYPEAKKTTLREMVEAKRVRINGTVVRSVKQNVAAGARVEVVEAAAAGREMTVLAEGLKLVYFDAEIVIVEKPAGLLTATDAIEKRPTAWRILQEYFRRVNHKNKVHLIHRLDREASGLLVFARTWEAYGELKRQFFEHSISRVYDVVVRRVPKERKGRLENYLVEDQEGVVHVTMDVKKGKPAILDYEVAEVNEERGVARVRCSLYTGRKHQIRVQLAAIGCPVVGDEVYGGKKMRDARSQKPEDPREKAMAVKKEKPSGRLMLHAGKLGFVHPGTGKVVVFESPMPGGMRQLVG